MTRQEDYIQAVKRFNAFLEEKHLRKTPERFAILKQVWQMEAHFGIDRLHAALEAEGYHVSRATAYNTIDLLVQCGVLRRHNFSSGESQYEAAREGHLHLICTRCGAIIEVSTPPAMSRMLESDSFEPFRPAYLLAYVYGLCGDCAARNPQKADEN
ncbi:MAG: transcriptional repressor [Muribaculaceae bacterium]|nr:transcriptional repressor [Muribaculaceae bacterium]